MLGLQVSIGALNDLVDAARDAATKPGKPIPRGAASALEARLITIVGLALAVVLTAPSGPLALAVLAVGAACGYAYDLWLSRSALSWLPLAVALPLVPVFAWIGPDGTVPGPVLAIVPAGILAGAGLALANGLADLERDRSQGAVAAAVRLGLARTWAIQAGLLGLAVAWLAVAALLTSGTGSGGSPAIRAAGAIAGAATIALGIWLGRSGGPARRERAWELEALGVALLAIGWFGSLVGQA